MDCRLLGLSTAAMGLLALSLITGCTDAETSDDASGDASTVAAAGSGEADRSESAAESRRRAAERARERMRERGDDDEAAGDAPGAAEDRVFIVAEPSTLELGEIPTNSSKAGTVKLRNVSDRPVTVLNSRTSCGCTVANVPTGEAIAPGESVEIEVSLRASGRPEVLQKTVTFMFEEQDPLQMTVRGQAISFVTMEPTVLTPRDNSETTVTLKSADGDAFRITSMHPPIARNFSSDEAKSEHELVLSWEQWEEHGQARRVLFYVDHPKTAMVTATIRVPVADRESRAAGRGDLGNQLSPRREGGPSRQPQDLFSLIENGRTDAFLAQFDSDRDVDETNRRGVTLLSMAASQGNLEIMKALIDAGADVHIADQRGRTALIEAAQSNNPEAVRLLIEEGADLDAQDQGMGVSALGWAAGFGRPDSVRLLVDHGARTDIIGPTTGFTPMSMAAGFGRYSESIEILAKAGADLERPCRLQGLTPIMHAIRTGRANNVSTLIDLGVDLEARADSGMTPLLLACSVSAVTLDIVMALVDGGADLTAKDRDGRTALELAQRRTDPRAEPIVTYLKELTGG